MSEDESEEEESIKRISEASGSASVGDDRDDFEHEHESGSRQRHSSFGFDAYKFQNPILDDNDDVITLAETEAEKEAAHFIEMARLKTTEYSKLDVVRMASAMGGLALDESMVEPVLIPETSNERIDAVREIYGDDMEPITQPFEDPVKALQADKDAGSPSNRIRSPPNLYEALQSNFLKSNYKTPLYRLFLMGTHDENLSIFIEWNKEVIDMINIQSYTEPLMGVLCVYEYYYIHIIEGSEDNLTKLMEKYANDLEPSGYEWDLRFNPKQTKYKAKDTQRLHTVQSWVLGIFRIQKVWYSCQTIMMNGFSRPERSRIRRYIKKITDLIEETLIAF